MHVNPQGFGPNKAEKIEQFEQSCSRYNANACLIAAIDRQWTTIVQDQMYKQLRKLERNAIMIMSDSGNNTNIRKIWLPGGTMSAVWGECRQFANEESTY